MNNVVAYSLQVLLLVAGGALLAWLFRLKLPEVRLWFWQGVLAVCLLLPIVQPRQTSRINFNVDDNPIQAGIPIDVKPGTSLPITEILVGIYAAGVAIRAVWLLLGCWRLRRYYRNAIELYPENLILRSAKNKLGTFPEIRFSSEVSSPVAFGLVSPVVLLPPSFADLDEGVQEAIAVHELMHVRRGDWIFSVSEEIVRSVLWFHPAIWWLLAQIQLSREQVVDRATVEFTQSREQYLEALLAIAKTKVRPDLGLAPLFLKKRHLARRVSAVMKDVHMSKRQVLSSFATVFALALVTARVAVFVFPLESSAQEIGEDQTIGVTVDTQEQKLLHGAVPTYPRGARDRRIQGTVVLQLSVNNKGQVTDARVESGPDELRAAALTAALQWHFANESGQAATKKVSLTFTLPPSTVGEVSKSNDPMPLSPIILQKIVYMNVPDNLRAAVQSRISVREGDALSNEVSERARLEVRSVDEHLNVGHRIDGSNGSAVLFIFLGNTPGSIPEAPSAFNPPATAGVKRIRVGGNIQASKIINRTAPVYPPLAKQARIQGTVRYSVLIGTDGGIQAMELVTGHPLLVEASTPVVRQWKYQPTLLNGEPTEVITMIDVNFTLTK